MPQQPASAIRTRLSSIDATLTGTKLRIAGRVLSYDVATGIAVIIDGKNGLLVDASLTIDSESKEWATDHLCTVVAIGDLESSDAPLQIPFIESSRASALTISNHLVLRAIIVVPSPHLDLALWNDVLKEEEGSRSGR